MILCLFNPAIETHQGRLSSNLGDLLIEKAVRRELKTVFGRRWVWSISSHVYPEKKHLLAIQFFRRRIVGGTNLLSSNMDEYNQWKINLKQANWIRTAILFGVGWWQYQEAPNAYTEKLLKRCLSSRALHSVRDSYTEKKLRSIGFNNVINTGCPTMWPLARQKPDDIPCQKANTALLMLTDYYSRPELDGKLVDLVLEKYEKVYYWPQGRYDLELPSQKDRPLIRLEPTVEALDEFLQNYGAFDYIGTRLHGGIMCLLAKKRSLILEVDNRAREIARDTGLPTTARDNYDYIAHWISNPTPVKITINEAAIRRWRGQFKLLR